MMRVERIGAPSYVADTIRAHLPMLGIAEEGTVTPSAAIGNCHDACRLGCVMGQLTPAIIVAQQIKVMAVTFVGFVRLHVALARDRFVARGRRRRLHRLGRYRPVRSLGERAP
jgi:hypothetical protein